MTKPLTRKEFDELTILNPKDKHGYRKPGPYTKRLLATIEQGFAPEQPTPDELVEWAATEVMGWRYDENSDMDPVWVGDFPYFVIMEHWSPDENWHDLIQVLIHAKQPFHIWHSHNHGEGAVMLGASVFVTPETKHDTPLDALRWLHRNHNPQ